MPHTYYFAYYRFDLSDQTFRDISRKNTCHYHTHSLLMLANIRSLLAKYRALYADSPSGEGWRLYEAVDRLFAGAGVPKGKPGSVSAIWQFWQAQQIKYTLSGCPPCEDKDCEEDARVAEYYSSAW